MRVAGHNSEYSIITLQPIHSYIKFESLAVSLVSLASLNPHSTSLRSDPSDGIFFRVRRTRRQNQQARGLIQFEIARATLVFNKIIHLQKKSNKKRFSVTKRQDTHTNHNKDPPSNNYNSKKYTRPSALTLLDLCWSGYLSRACRLHLCRYCNTMVGSVHAQLSDSCMCDNFRS